MAIFLYIIGLLCGVIAGFSFLAAQYVTGQAVALGFAICGCVLFVGGAIVEAINKAHTTLALFATSANKYMQAVPPVAAPKPTAL